jgi:hypothetical protein
MDDRASGKIYGKLQLGDAAEVRALADDVCQHLAAMIVAGALAEQLGTAGE